MCEMYECSKCGAISEYIDRCSNCHNIDGWDNQEEVEDEN
jgi:hypothetical protein